MKNLVRWSKVLAGDVQIVSDGRTCWVNEGSGGCIGRWSPVGVDIHRTAEEQLDDGHQCLDCSEGGSWDSFVKSMRYHYEIEIPADLIDAEYAGQL